MNRLRLTTVLLAAFGLLIGRTPAGAAEENPAANVKPATMEKYEKKAREVFANLVKAFPQVYAQRNPIGDYEWDKIELLIVDSMESGFPAPNDKIYANAYASEETINGKHYPKVTITRGYLAALQGDDSALALVFGHELGHHACGHCLQGREFKAAVRATADGHRREADADKFGVTLLLKANYSLRAATRVSYRAMEAIGGLYCSCQGTKQSHPAWTDRLARIAALADSDEEKLWRNMTAFDNGVFFLRIEDYAAAESCFLTVTQEFPNCGEAWANLGMARLMRYCDNLSAEDLSRLGVGQFIGGVRFGSAQSLVTRGNTLLPAAVAALEKAHKLMPKSATILVGLGLAALVNAHGAADADRYFAQAVALVEAGQSDLDEPTKLALLLNRGVASIATGQTAVGLAHISRAKALTAKLNDRTAQEYAAAALFNTAVALSADHKNAEAVLAFEQYLRTNSPSNPWWSVAYERYASLNESLGETPASRGSLAPNNPKVRLRTHAALAVAANQSIHIGQPMAKVKAILGTPAAVTTDRISGLKRLAYPAHGLVIFADDDEVYYLMIASAGGPAIELREAGNGGRSLGQIALGMTRREVEALPGGGNWTLAPFTSLATVYPYYYDLGISVIYDGDGHDAKILAILIGSTKADPVKG